MRAMHHDPAIPLADKTNPRTACPSLVRLLETEKVQKRYCLIEREILWVRQQSFDELLFGSHPSPSILASIAKDATKNSYNY